jgi:hypothetical protein
MRNDIVQKLILVRLFLLFFLFPYVREIIACGGGGVTRRRSVLRRLRGGVIFSTAD